MEEQLRSELLQMYKVDQDIRNRAMKDMDNRELVAQFVAADQRNTQRLREIVALHGWPGKTLVGGDGEHAAWLLVQHADHAPDFQEFCLGLMSAAPAGEVDRRNMAYLVDRVRVNTGRLQVYGTQFWTDETGMLVPRPMEDGDEVEERRASVGLGTFADYREQMLAIHAQAEATRRPPESE